MNVSAKIMIFDVAQRYVCIKHLDPTLGLRGWWWRGEWNILEAGLPRSLTVST